MDKILKQFIVWLKNYIMMFLVKGVSHYNTVLSTEHVKVINIIME